MGNETSQDFPSDDDHDPMVSHPSMPPRSTTPLSEVASMCSRRLSSASLGQFDDPPEVDLSHLSREERAKIAAVMARARQAQDEEADRIRWVLHAILSTSHLILHVVMNRTMIHIRIVWAQCNTAGHAFSLRVTDANSLKCFSCSGKMLWPEPFSS